MLLFLRVPGSPPLVGPASQSLQLLECWATPCSLTRAVPHRGTSVPDVQGDDILSLPALEALIYSLRAQSSPH